MWLSLLSATTVCKYTVCTNHSLLNTPDLRYCGVVTWLPLAKRVTYPGLLGEHAMTSALSLHVTAQGLSRPSLHPPIVQQ